MRGLGKEWARIFQRFLVVGGKLRAVQPRQSLVYVMLQLQELAPKFSLLRRALARFKGGNFGGRGLGIFLRGGFIGLGGRFGARRTAATFFATSIVFRLPWGLGLWGHLGLGRGGGFFDHE